MVDLRLADGRTTLRFRSRAQAVTALKRNVKDMDADDKRPIKCWALWHAEQEEWEPTQIMYIRPNSVSFVRKVPGPERAVFEQTFPEAIQRPSSSPPEVAGEAGPAPSGGE